MGEERNKVKCHNE